jgi:tetratricopeptide (TPR) repeat protein
MLEECLAAVREIGDKRGIALALNNVGNIFYLKNDLHSAQTYYEETLRLGNESDDRYVKSVGLTSLGITLFRQGKLVEANLYYQESLALNREMGDKVGLSLIHCYLGLLALGQNQPSQARASFVEGLTIAHQSEIKLYTIYNLIGMARLFSTQRRIFPTLVTLLAASTGIAEALGLKIEPELQEPYDQALSEARMKLSEADFVTLWKVGETMDIEKAFQFALET